MPTYHVALSLTRPPNYGDTETVALLRQAIERAACLAVDVTTVGFVVDCEPAALDVLETSLRAALGARGGSLERMIGRQI